MSEQSLDLRSSIQKLRRFWIVLVILGVLGILAGAAYVKFKPPMYTATALVILPVGTKDVPTQVVVGDSEHVLVLAERVIGPAVSLQMLREQVQVKMFTPNTLSFSAQDTNAAQAERIANGVARSYIGYVTTSDSVGPIAAQMLQQASTVTGKSLRSRMVEAGIVGALCGLLVAIIGVLAANRSDRRLRRRDELADVIGVPVLASVVVLHPTDAARWTRLLEDYEPSTANGWRLRNALGYLGVIDARPAQARVADTCTITVLSLSSDRRALALGPQLAVFAASLGIPTALVVGPQQDTNATAALRTACSAYQPSPRLSGFLQATVWEPEQFYRPPAAALTVIVTVVHDRGPRPADLLPTDVTVLGVSAGAATAEQLARAAAGAASAGHPIEGILVADPDVSDPTTGRIPQLARPTRRVRPTRVTGIKTESRR